MATIIETQWNFFPKKGVIIGGRNKIIPEGFSLKDMPKSKKDQEVIYEINQNTEIDMELFSSAWWNKEPLEISFFRSPTKKLGVYTVTSLNAGIEPLAIMSLLQEISKAKDAVKQQIRP